jgi:outer membrane protein assembly factor BamB
VLKRVVVASVALIAIAAIASPAAQARRAPTRCDWPMFGHDAARSFETPAACSSVTTTSAPTLHPKWLVHTTDAVSASPSIVDGHVFVGDWSGTFYSLDAATGAVDWTYAIDDTSSVGFGRIVSSAAYTEIGSHKVVLFGGGATLYALDASSGALLASQCLDPRSDVDRCHTPGDEVEIESSPAIVRARNGATSVFVGMDVHNGSNVGRARAS